MSENNNLMAFASLLDLAAADTSELKAQVSRLPLQGIYIVDMTEAKFTEQAPNDPSEPMNYNLVFKNDILHFEPLNKEDAGKAESLVGKALGERYFLYGKELLESIQLLMGRYKTVGFKHKGPMGGVEGQAPGWIDEAIGKRIAIRVAHYTAKDGQDRARFDWLGQKAMEKAGIDWAILQRDFLDENGAPVAEAA